MLFRSAKFDSDSAAVDSIDPVQIESEERAMLQPYVDRFEGNMKAAGFGLSG